MQRFRKSIRTVQLKQRGLILCEGETEVLYFKSIVNDDKYKRQLAAVNVDIYKPKDHSPLGLVREAKSCLKKELRAKNPYDFIWVVFDQDGHENISNAFHEARNCNPEINIAFTIRCFEIFILLHYSRSTKAYESSDKLITSLQVHLPSYQKAYKDLYKETKSNMDQAIANSEWLYNQYKIDIEGGMPVYKLPVYSSIHLLIKFLKGLADKI